MEDAAPVSIPPRRLETPKREALLAHYAAAENTSKAILAIESILGVSALWWIAARAPNPVGAIPWVAFGLGALAVFRWFLEHIFLNKKRLEDIRPDARFGEHTRASLVNLTDGVFARLGIRRQSVPVFLTRSKDVNAQALRCELWPGWHLFNGVFLNRSIIHLLDERELASVIGHELGHVFPYAPLLSRCYGLHSLFAGTVSMALAAAFPHPGVALIAPLAIAWGLSCGIAFPHLRLSRGIEFLCDDYGAQAAGLLPALSSEVKIALEQETRQHLMLRLLHARGSGMKISLIELAEAYEEAIPFGKADAESFGREFQKHTDERQRADRGISLGGFLRHLQGGDHSAAEDWAGEQIKELELINALPLLPLDRSAYLQGSHAWSLDTAERLSTTIEQIPAAVLVRSLGELDDRSLSHPNASRRILFLWRNRSVYPQG